MGEYGRDGRVNHAYLASVRPFGRCIFFALLLLALIGPREASAQAFVLTKTPAPTTYTAAGQTITYTFVVTTVAIDSYYNISLVDDKLGVVACPRTTMGSPDTMTCTGTYTITAADITAGSVTNNATVTGYSTDDSELDNPFASLAARQHHHAAPPAGGADGSITIVKNAIGGNNTFNFTSPVPARPASRWRRRAARPRDRSRACFRHLHVRRGQSAAALEAHALTCTGDAAGTPTTANVSAGLVSIGLDAGEAIICTFTNCSTTRCTSSRPRR